MYRIYLLIITAALLISCKAKRESSSETRMIDPFEMAQPQKLGESLISKLIDIIKPEEFRLKESKISGLMTVHHRSSLPIEAIDLVRCSVWLDAHSERKNNRTLPWFFQIRYCNYQPQFKPKDQPLRLEIKGLTLNESWVEYRELPAPLRAIAETQEVESSYIPNAVLEGACKSIPKSTYYCSLWTAKEKFPEAIEKVSNTRLETEMGGKFRPVSFIRACYYRLDTKSISHKLDTLYSKAFPGNTESLKTGNPIRNAINFLNRDLCLSKKKREEELQKLRYQSYYQINGREKVFTWIEASAFPSEDLIRRTKEELESR